MDNLSFVTSHPSVEVQDLYIRKDLEGEEFLAPRNGAICLINRFLSLFNTNIDLLFGQYQEKLESISSLINKNIEQISGDEQSSLYWDEKTKSTTTLFDIVQKYNQQIFDGSNNLARTLELNKEISIPQLANRLAAKQSLIASSPRGKLVKDELHPHIVTEKSALRGKQRHYHYDAADHGFDHASEARKIFFSTQRERFLSLFNHRHRYNCHGVSDEVIYAEDKPFAADNIPTSYWIGHATCLMNIPVHSNKGQVSTITLLTDPVFGDLHPLLYPRKTRPGMALEEIPPPDVVLISHDHWDHLEIKTVRKLVSSHNPLIIVPKGVKNWIKRHNIPSDRVIELNWWEKTTVKMERNGADFALDITMAPANHWSGRYGCDAHETLFAGYIIESEAVDGGIYFAGDTARLKEAHIEQMLEHHNIRYQFQPGGPDEMREEMQSTHQSSADALWMHFKLTVQAVYQERAKEATWESFIPEVKKYRTLMMHTMTFKLGNIHLRDTQESFDRIYKQLEQLAKGADLEADAMKPHENEVLDNLLELGMSFVLPEEEGGDERGMHPREILDILRSSVIVPKIGSRTTLCSITV